MGLTAAIARSVRDLLDHAVPLITANVVWGVLAFLAWFAAALSPVTGIAAAIALAWPTVTVATVAARVVRGEELTLRDALRWPLTRPAVLVLGAATVLGATIGVVDLTVGLERGDMMGMAFATAAVWGLIALIALACVAWPLLGDPRRATLSTGRLVRLALTVAFVRTPRVLLTASLVTVWLVLSGVFAAALLTVSLALATLVLCRVMLPIADAIDPAT
jgi:hypothetical protein